MRPRASVAERKARSAYAAFGKRMQFGDSPSARLYTATPQPESCFSDCRIMGFSDSSSSCRSETGSDATQPSTRHMGGVYSPAQLRGGRTSQRARLSRRKLNEGSNDGGAEEDLVGAPPQAVRARAAG